jgi:hypothetical protein
MQGIAGGLQWGAEPRVFYLRFGRPVDHRVHAMPSGR